MAILGTALAFLGAELALRITKPQMGWHAHRDSLLGWSSREYQRWTPAERVAGDERTRVLVLGDSLLAGGGLNHLDQRFTSQAGKALTGRAEVEVLASSGWGTDQELLAFVSKGRRWLPDYVFVAFCAVNDISNNFSNSNPSGMSKPYFALDENDHLRLYDSTGAPIRKWAEQSLSPPWFYSYVWESARWLYLRFQLSYQKPQSPTSSTKNVDPRYLHFKFFDPTEIYNLRPRLSWSPQHGVNHVSAYIRENFPNNAYQWRLQEALLRQLKQEVEAVGGELVVMLLPISFKSQDPRFISGGSMVYRFETPRGPFTFRAAEPRDRLSAIAARIDVDFFDPTPGFIETAALDDTAKRFWPNPQDRHFGPEAHRVLAGQFRSYLEQRLRAHPGG